MRDYTNTDAPPYARQYVCKIGNEVRSQGIGFNIWSLLLMNSLFKGSDPFNAHPSVSHVFSNNLMSLILANAPPGATPGDTVPLRYTSTHTHTQAYKPTQAHSSLRENTSLTSPLKLTRATQVLRRLGTRGGATYNKRGEASRAFLASQREEFHGDWNSPSGWWDRQTLARGLPAHSRPFGCGSEVGL
jgi:hypothetical protein